MTTNLKIQPIVETLTAARQRIAQKGWIQNHFCNSLGYCLVGALRGEYGAGPFPETEIRRLVTKAIGRVSFSSWHSVYAWNDAPERTKEQVLAVLDKAIALALGVKP